MITQTIEIKTADGICDAFIAHPTSGAHPAVILYMDAFGLRPYLEQMAKKIAEQGYFVLVPNLFYRIKRAPVTDLKFPLKPEDMVEAVQKIIPLARGHDPQLTMNDVNSFFGYLGKHSSVRHGKMGITGYCMGGSLALRTAAAFPDQVAAAASYHAGNLASEAPHSPHLLLSKIKAKIYVAHADHDSSMPVEQIERFQNALSDSKANGKAELYSNALHGFTMEDLPAFNAEALDRHWKTLFELLQSELN